MQTLDDQFVLAKPIMVSAVGVVEHPHPYMDLTGQVSGLNLQGMGGISEPVGSLMWASETIDRSTSLFSQLDSMIAAVQTESSALDSMREKVKELDGLRLQLSSITKRLLESDQNNLTLKGSLFQLQEAFNDMRRQKQELESTMVPLRQELNRTKEMYSKERMTRLAAQQEVSMLKDQLQRVEKINEDLEREVKSIPALSESNELLKQDLSRVRGRYKEERAALQAQARSVEAQAR